VHMLAFQGDGLLVFATDDDPFIRDTILSVTGYCHSHLHVT